MPKEPNGEDKSIPSIMCTLYWSIWYHFIVIRIHLDATRGCSQSA